MQYAPIRIHVNESAEQEQYNTFRLVYDKLIKLYSFCKSCPFKSMVIPIISVF